MLNIFRSRINPVEVRVVQCRRNDTETMTYVLSYLVPFVGGILKDSEATVAYLVFFLVIGLLYANSNMVHVNPMLNLFGFRLYEAKLASQDTFILISRNRITSNKTVKVAAIGDDVYLESKL